MANQIYLSENETKSKFSILKVKVAAIGIL